MSGHGPEATLKAEGAKAFQDGQPRSACPVYPAGQQRFKGWWEDGYDEAKTKEAFKLETLDRSNEFAGMSNGQKMQRIYTLYATAATPQGPGWNDLDEIARGFILHAYSLGLLDAAEFIRSSGYDGTVEVADRIVAAADGREPL